METNSVDVLIISLHVFITFLIISKAVHVLELKYCPSKWPSGQLIINIFHLQENVKNINNNGFLTDINLQRGRTTLF